ncbi:hypothetical protein ACJRO7_000131 [Eucalyptus globulus]|uniref:DUF4220 domain-containing protein n=1 Tax=Eucalyptus globulus TaxID=34317 RepID=A0ABD3LRY3_EUCGL
MAFSSILYLWNEWNIRGFVILSLLLQIILILFAPLRKKTKNNHIVFLLWLAYLIADSVAAFGIGLISHNEGSSCAHVAEVDRALRAFWASFLLLHLGGPDTITAFSLEDNSLWRRHLLNLTFQVGAAIYVFVQIFPSDKSLVLPTMLIFLAGVIKNVERTLALNLSSLPRLRERVLSQEGSLDDEGDEIADELIGPSVGYSHGEEEAKLAESIVVKHAYYFFQISKAFLTNLIFTYKQREISKAYFHEVSAVDALRVISVELHFIYEVLHTKTLTIRFKWSYFFRFIAFIDVAMAFVLFNRLKKHRLPKLDVKITYLLLFGGIALDVIAVLMLVFSDWTIAEIQWHKIRSSTLCSFLHGLVSTADDLWMPRFGTWKAKPNTKVTYKVLKTPLLFRRWSESICACNLLSKSLEKNPRKMYKRDWHRGNITFSNICSFPFYMAEKTISFFHQAVTSIAGGCGLMKQDGKRSVIANTRYVSTNPFILKLWIFIFEEVRRKSIYPIDEDRSEEGKRREERERERTTGKYKWIYGTDETVEIERTKEIYEARGNWFLRILPSEARLRSLNDCDTEGIHEATDNEFPQNNQNIQGRIEPSILYNYA